MKLLVRSLVAGALAAALAVPLGGAPAHAATKPKHHVSSVTKDDGRRSFGVQPATHGKPDTRAFLSYSVTPGAVLRDEVAVINVSAQPAKLTVYAADAFNAASGAFDVRPVAVKATDVGAWLRLRIRSTSQQVTVPGRSNVLVPIELTVPVGALPGDHAGGIVASLRTEARNAQGQNVHLDQRVGVRVYVRVSGDLRPRLSVQALRAHFEATGLSGQGVVRVTYVVRNTGNITLSGRQRVAVTGWLRTNEVGPRLPLLPQLLPGSSFRVSTTVRGVPPTGRLAVTATVLPLPLAGVIDPTLLASSATVHVWALAWWLALIVALVGLVGFLVFRRIRSRLSGAPGVVVELPAPRERTPASTTRDRSMLAAMVVGGLAALSVAWVGPAAAAQGGNLTFLPGKGLDITPTYAVSSGPCPAGATNVLAVATGHGFPSAGQVVISSSSASLRHDAPMVIHLQDTFNGFAAVNATKLSGPYKVLLTCIDRLHQHTYASFVGTVVFHDATHFTADVPSPATRDKVLVSGPVPGQPAPGLGTAPTVQPSSGTGQGSPGAGQPSSGAGHSSGGSTAGGSTPGGTSSGGQSPTSSAGPQGEAPSNPAAAAPVARRSASGGAPSWVMPLGLLAGAATLAAAVFLFRREGKSNR